MCILVGVSGGFHGAAQASDHLPFNILLSGRSTRRRGLPRIPAHIASSSVFRDILDRKCVDLAMTRGAARRLASLTELAHQAARLSSRTLAAIVDSTPRLLADAAMRAYTCLRSARSDEAAQFADALPKLPPPGCKC